MESRYPFYYVATFSLGKDPEKVKMMEEVKECHFKRLRWRRKESSETTFQLI